MPLRVKVWLIYVSLIVFGKQQRSLAQRNNLQKSAGFGNNDNRVNSVFIVVIFSLDFLSVTKMMEYCPMYALISCNRYT